jgi:hypothetical protein
LKNAEVVYVTEAEISAVSGNGTFEITHRRFFSYVMPTDLDDPDGKMPDISEGWEKKRHKLSCTLTTGKVSCSDENKQQITFNK